MAIHAISVMLVDDHPMVRMGFKQLLSSVPDIEVIAEADTGEQAISDYRKVRPDILVMDLSMPGMGGMAAARHIIETDPKARIILLTMHGNRAFPVRALKLGVRGYITKNGEPDELIKAIRMVHRGRKYIDSDIAQDLAVHSASGKTDPIDILSPREFEVFCALADGHSVNEISEILHLSPKTVGVHRTNILRKLDVNNLAELTRIAIRHNVITA